MSATKPILFTLLLFITLYAEAQTLKTNYWGVKWLPTSLITPIEPHFRFGVEKRWGDHGVSMQAGASIPRTYIVDNNIKGTIQGYAGRLEWRQYRVIKPDEDDFDMYLGAEAFYYFTHGKDTREYEHPDSANAVEYEDQFYDDEYAYKRNVYGVVSKFGLQYRTRVHLYLELSVGLGFKILDNRQMYRDNVNHRPKPDPQWRQQTDETTVLWSPAIPVLIAIGYWF